MKFKVMLIFFLFNQNLYAGVSGWTAVVKIEELAFPSNGGMNVRFAPNASLANCIVQGGYGGFSQLLTTHASFKTLSANLSLAFVAGKNIQIYFNDSTTCTIHEVRIFN